MHTFKTVVFEIAYFVSQRGMEVLIYIKMVTTNTLRSITVCQDALRAIILIFNIHHGVHFINVTL